MKTAIARCAVALALLAGTAAAQADQFVITNTGITLTPAEVRDVYLGEKQFAGSVKLQPVDSYSTQEQFLAKVLNMDRAKYTTVWTKKAFREGLVQPPLKTSDSDVLDFVRRTPGAVGYVAVPPSGVNIVEKY